MCLPGYRGTLYELGRASSWSSMPPHLRQDRRSRIRYITKGASLVSGAYPGDLCSTDLKRSASVKPRYRTDSSAIKLTFD